MSTGIMENIEVTQPAVTCSKLTIETLEQGMTMFKVNNKDTRTLNIFQSWTYFDCEMGTLTRNGLPW